MDLAVAYTNAMNPIQLNNPVIAGNMPTADSLHSAFSRRRLSVLPRVYCVPKKWYITTTISNEVIQHCSYVHDDHRLYD